MKKFPGFLRTWCILILEYRFFIRSSKMARSEREERVGKFIDFVGYFRGYERDIL